MDKGVLDTFEGLNLTDRQKKIFADVIVKRVVLSKQEGIVTVYLTCSHVIAYREPSSVTGARLKRAATLRRIERLCRSRETQRCRSRGRSGSGCSRPRPPQAAPAARYPPARCSPRPRLPIRRRQVCRRHRALHGSPCRWAAQAGAARSPLLSTCSRTRAARGSSRQPRRRTQQRCAYTDPHP